MTRHLVTGAAGFIGSTLVERLAASGDAVVALDALVPGHDLAQRTANWETSPPVPRLRVDLAHDALDGVLDGVDVVHHLAGRPGVQSSWGDGFADHVDGNVLATQRLLEAALVAGVGRVVLASSSSVYGDGGTGPSAEDGPVAPVSPYGVAKLAAEHLAGVYRARGLDVVVLRYFTVYGPRQRPDMAVHRLVAAALGGPAFPLRATLDVRRELTFVDDVVEATVRAATVPAAAGTTINVGGGRSATLAEVVAEIGRCTGAPVPLRPVAARPGDPAATRADIRLARRVLAWAPATSLADGIARQVAWHRALRRTPAPVRRAGLAS